MTEYIEREAAIEAVKKERDYTGKFSFEEEHGWAVGFQQGISFALSDVAAIPAADVVPVVRCRDCKHNKRARARRFLNANDDTAACYAGHAFPPLDWFCADGERKEES